METCIRGFSYMPESIISSDMKYVESTALEQTWKSTRRERLKQQEQKIWEEFVLEKDVVSSVSQDDPYQFLDPLPESQLQELLEAELQKMKQMKLDEEVRIQEQIEEKNSPGVDNQHVVTFVEDSDKDKEKEVCEMIQVFDDKEDDVSGPEEEALNESLGSPPLTVRERAASPASRARSPDVDKASSKSSENITNMIETSIHCAKIKDIGIKINEELADIVIFLEQQNVMNIDPVEIPKIQKHSVEFSARFNRVHMYQLTRQMYDMKRHESGALPFGQHTHLQAQLARAAALHHSLLHATQVYAKSLPLTCCMRESAELLRALLRAVRDAADLTPRAARHDIENISHKVEDTLNEYTLRMSEYLSSVDNTSATYSRKSSKLKGKKKSIGTWSKTGSKSLAAADARLSMYSLDTLRLKINSKTSSSKDIQSGGTSKMNASICQEKHAGKEEAPQKSQRKTPRSRRPFMREAGGGRGGRAGRGGRSAREEVHTLVEAVAACTSSHISQEATPPLTPRSKDVTPRRHSVETTPRTPKTKDNGKSLNSTPRKLPQDPTPIRPSSLDNGSPKKSPRPLSIDNIEREERGGKERAVPLGKDKVGDAQGVTEKDAKEGTKKSERDRNKVPEKGPASCEVTRLLRQLCGGDTPGSRNERVTGSKNAQLLCVSGGSPRQPSTPQLLRILEETIQKKAPKTLFPKPVVSLKDAEKYRMSFNVSDKTTENLFQYRTRFVQHMLASSLYANSAVGKPWEMIGSVSEQIIDELLLGCVKEMELQHVIQDMYKSEIR